MFGDTKNQRLFSIQCLIDWLKIRQNEGMAFPQDLDKLVADIDHSALLNRLLEGKRPLPEPPPCSFSYPWYELIETGEATPSEVSIIGDRAIINQMEWRICDRVSNDNYLVSYGNGIKQYHLLRTNGRWFLTKFK